LRSLSPLSSLRCIQIVVIRPPPSRVGARPRRSLQQQRLRLSPTPSRPFRALAVQSRQNEATLRSPLGATEPFWNSSNPSNKRTSSHWRSGELSLLFATAFGPFRAKFNVFDAFQPIRSHPSNASHAPNRSFECPSSIGPELNANTIQHERRTTRLPCNLQREHHTERPSSMPTQTRGPSDETSSIILLLTALVPAMEPTATQTLAAAITMVPSATSIPTHNNNHTADAHLWMMNVCTLAPLPKGSQLDLSSIPVRLMPSAPEPAVLLALTALRRTTAPPAPTAPAMTPAPASTRA
jgi:hypothetical protein